MTPAEGPWGLPGAIIEDDGSGPACIACQGILSEVESGTGVGFELAALAPGSSRYRGVMR